MQNYSDEQLLALIEGELDAEEAAHLRRSIEQSDPALARRLEAMAGDRAALRDLPPVDPPIDFLAEIEPMIARPMLMDSPPAQPGAARRAHHRRHRRAQLLQAAVAAVVVLGVSAAILVTLDATGVFNGESSTTVAERSQPVQTNADAKDPGATVDDVTGAGQIHHKLPALASAVEPAPQLRAGGAPRPAPGRSTAAEAPEPVEVDFALVLEASDADAAEAALTAALATDAAHTALVRNLSVEELQRIEQQWLARRAAAGNPVRDPLYADVDGRSKESPRASARRPRLAPSMLTDNAEQLVRAGLVAGDQRLMPPYSRQIELSESGAAYTVAVPLSDLQRMLERLNAAGSNVHSAALRTIDVRTLGASDAADGSDESNVTWPEQLERIRATLAELAQTQPDAVVLMPVVVEHDAK